MSSGSGLLLRKRGSADIHRRRSGALGAVRIEEGCAQGLVSPSASLASTADLDTPQDSPLISCKSRPGTASDETAASRRSDHVLLSAGNWETAATQVVQKSLDVIADRGSQRSPQPQASGKLFKLSSDTLLDKGLDAINNVGKLMEGFALSLDNVIGQAFEEWGTPKAAARPQPRPAQRLLASVDENTDPRAAPEAAAPAAAAPKAHPAAEAWGDFPLQRQHVALDSAAATEIIIPSKREGADSGKPARKTAFMSKLDAASDEDVQRWRKRALLLQRELQKLNAQQSEYQRLKEQYECMQAEMQSTSTEVVKLAEENSKLKQGGTPSSAGLGQADPVTSDPLAAQQVMQQMEALLAEKAKLAQENDRLLRENNGLQELLEFTIIHQVGDGVIGDDELFADEYESDEAAGCGDGADGAVAGTSEECSPGTSP